MSIVNYEPLILGTYIQRNALFAFQSQFLHAAKDSHPCSTELFDTIASMKPGFPVPKIHYEFRSRRQPISSLSHLI